MISADKTPPHTHTCILPPPHTHTRSSVPVTVIGVTFQHCYDTAVVVWGPFSSSVDTYVNDYNVTVREAVVFVDCVFLNNRGNLTGAVYVHDIGNNCTPAVRFSGCRSVHDAIK